MRFCNYELRLYDKKEKATDIADICAIGFWVAYTQMLPSILKKIEHFMELKEKKSLKENS